MSDWKIRVTEVLVVTRELTSKSYPDMMAEEAKAYEEGMLLNEKLQNLMENLAYIEENDIIYTEKVSIVTE